MPLDLVECDSAVAPPTWLKTLCKRSFHKKQFPMTSLPSNVKVFAEQPEDSTIAMLKELAKLPFFVNQPIRVMPDCHSGKGTIVGFSAPYDTCIIPSIIGVDIGCGMFVIRLPNKLLEPYGGKISDQSFLKNLDEITHREVPAGYYGKHAVPGGPTGFHQDVSEARFKRMLSHLLPCLSKYCPEASGLLSYDDFVAEFEYWHDYLDLRFTFHSLMKCCGTLGSGNHFVELDSAKSGEGYIVVHSGSRGLGGAIASKFISAAEIVTKVLLGIEPAELLVNDTSPFFKLLFNNLQALKKMPTELSAENPGFTLPISAEDKKAFYLKLRDEIQEELKQDASAQALPVKEYKAELTRRINARAVEYLSRCKLVASSYDYLSVFPLGTTEEDIEAYKAILVKNPNVACLYQSLGAEDYLRAMKFCQLFAKLNRLVIAFNIYCSLSGIPVQARGIWDDDFDPGIRAQAIATFMDSLFYTDCIHNYIDLQSKIMRKGSIRANKDDILIIPMNMRDGILVCKGLGNPDWNCTAPHGAGRIMSRIAAKRSIKLETVIEQMKGIYSTCLQQEVIDEAPDAYKPVAHITKHIQGTCTIIDQWKPLWNFKGMDCVFESKKEGNDNMH